MKQIKEDKFISFNNPDDFIRIKLDNLDFSLTRKNIMIYIIIFFGICLFILPSGIAFEKIASKLIEDPPGFRIILTILSIFSFSAVAYGLIFRGRALPNISKFKNHYITIVFTSLMLSFFFLLIFPFTEISSSFLIWIITWIIVLIGLTIVNYTSLPVIFIHQIGQYFYFASSEIPLLNDMGKFISGLMIMGILFVLGFLIYRNFRDKNIKHIHKSNFSAKDRSG